KRAPTVPVVGGEEAADPSAATGGDRQLPAPGSDPSELPATAPSRVVRTSDLQERAQCQKTPTPWVASQNSVCCGSAEEPEMEARRSTNDATRLTLRD